MNEQEQYSNLDIDNQDLVYCEVPSPQTRSFQDPSSAFYCNSSPPVEQKTSEKQNPILFKHIINHRIKKLKNSIEQRVSNEKCEVSSGEEEIERLKREIENYKQNAEKNEKMVSTCLSFFGELQYILQVIFDEITDPGLVLPETKKTVNLINDAIKKISLFAFENNLSLQPKVPKESFLEAERSSSPKIETVKKVLTYSDIMSFQTKTPDLPIHQNLSLKFENMPLQSQSEIKESEPDSNGKVYCGSVENISKYLDSERVDRENEATQRKYYSFGNSNALEMAKSHEDTVFPTARLGVSRFTELENESKEFQQKLSDIEAELLQANEMISHLQEEKKSSENIISQLRIQKEELIYKLRTYETKTTIETNNDDNNLTIDMLVHNSKDQADLLGKFLDFSDSAKPSIEKNKLENYSEIERFSLSNHISSFNFSKPKEGSQVKNTKNALNQKLTNEKDNEDMLKNYQNKILDVIEKLEDMKGIYHFLLLTSENIIKHEDDKISASWRAFKMEFERRKERLLQNMARVEFEQEANRKELINLMEQEDHLQKNCRDSVIFIEDQDSKQKHKQLEEENKELNKLIEALVKDNTSLKSQLKLQDTVDEYRKMVLKTQTEESTPSEKNRRLRLKKNSSVSSYNFGSSIVSVENQNKGSLKNLVINQADLFYMLNAQAASLETLLLNNIK